MGVLEGASLWSRFAHCPGHENLRKDSSALETLLAWVLAIIFADASPWVKFLLEDRWKKAF